MLQWILWICWIQWILFHLGKTQFSEKKRLNWSRLRDVHNTKTKISFLRFWTCLSSATKPLQVDTVFLSSEISAWYLGSRIHSFTNNTPDGGLSAHVMIFLSANYTSSSTEELPNILLRSTNTWVQGHQCETPLLLLSLSCLPLFHLVRKRKSCRFILKTSVLFE